MKKKTSTTINDKLQVFDILTINIVRSYIFLIIIINNTVYIINSIHTHIFLITLRIVNEILLIMPFDIDELQFLLLVR